MKPLLIFIIASGMAISTANAQGFQLGVKAGANLSKIDGVSFNDQFQLGYHAGVFSRIKFSKKWGIQPEVLFNQYNTKTVNDFAAVYSTENLKNLSLNYITIPMLLDFSPQKWISLQGGAQVGVMMDKSKSLLSNGEQAFSSGDVSLLGGVQFNLMAFKISGRYYQGLKNINNTGVDGSWKNKGFQISVGLRII